MSVIDVLQKVRFSDVKIEIFKRYLRVYIVIGNQFCKLTFRKISKKTSKFSKKFGAYNVIGNFFRGTPNPFPLL